MALATPTTASHPSRPAIPRPAYKARDGKTAALRKMDVGDHRDFGAGDANRIRVMACRLLPKQFRTRLIGQTVRIWRVT